MQQTDDVTSAVCRQILQPIYYRVCSKFGRNFREKESYIQLRWMSCIYLLKLCMRVKVH